VLAIKASTVIATTVLGRRISNRSREKGGRSIALLLQIWSAVRVACAAVILFFLNLFAGGTQPQSAAAAQAEFGNSAVT
jgi:hypothetical protein